MTTWRDVLGSRVTKEDLLLLHRGTQKQRYTPRRQASVVKQGGPTQCNSHPKLLVEEDALLANWLQSVRRACGHNIPIGLPNEDDLIDPRLDLIPILCDYGTDEDIKDSLFVTMLSLYAGIRLLESSDLPNRFYCHKNLCMQLAATQLYGLSGEDIHLPYPCFLLFPAPDMYTIFDERVFCFIVCTKKYDSMETSFWPSQFKRNGTDIRANYIPGRRIFITALTRYHRLLSEVPIPDSMTLERAMESEGPATGETIDPTALKIYGTHATRDTMRNSIKNLVLNFLLYLSSPDADKKHVDWAKIRDLKKAKNWYKRHGATIRELESKPEWLVGSTVRLSGEARQHMQQVLTGYKPARTLRTNILVRGFWRRQWYGKKTAENPNGEYQRPKWIEPFVRNAADGKLLCGHEYVAE